MDKKLQVIVLICSIIAAIWAGAWALKDKLVFAGDLQLMQKENIMTMKMLQQEIRTSQFQNEVRYIEGQLTIFYERMYNVKNILQKNPNNLVAKIDYESIKKKIDDLEKKLNELKLKGNNFNE